MVDSRSAGSLASSGFHPLQTESISASLALAAFLTGKGTARQISNAGTGAVMQSVSADLLGAIYVPPLDRLDGLDSLMQSVQAAAKRVEKTWSEGMRQLYDAVGWRGSTETAWLAEDEDQMD